MIDWEAIAAIGDIVGALGVIASLVYLSIQIRRSDETARAQSLQSVLDGHRDRSIFTGYTDPNFTQLLAKGLTDLQLLTTNQKRQFHNYVTETVFQMQQTMQLHERGLVSKVDYDAWLAHTGSIIKTPGGTAIWSQMESTITPTIRKLVNEYMADNPDAPSFIELIPLYNYSVEEEAAHHEIT
jgi:hypothetical protein